MDYGRLQLLVLSLLFSASAALAGDSFLVTVDVGSVTRGEKTLAKIRVIPGAGFHINKDYPAQIALIGSQGVNVKKKTDKNPTPIGESGAEFDIPLTCTEAGHKSVTGDLRLAVCTASTCETKKEKLSFSFECKMSGA